MTLSEDPLARKHEPGHPKTYYGKSASPTDVETVEISERKGQDKLNPRSAFSVGECSSQSELSKIVFTESPLLLTEPPSVVVFPSSVSCTSSASSVCSMKNTNSPIGQVTSTSNATNERVSEVSVITEIPTSTPTNVDQMCIENTVTEENKSPFASDETNEMMPMYSYMSNGEKIPIRHTHSSRIGREKQRWNRCPVTNRFIRLTTGCVPITNDGRILFVSSARKREWILPKGGWESDEKMEESAVRETYEEAGILGTLGPKLSEITYETRKGKKRRLERLEQEKHGLEQTNNLIGTFGGIKGTPQAQESFTKSTGAASNLNSNGLKQKNVDPEHVFQTSSETPKVYPEDAVQAKREHEMCRMTLFPLYVSDVLDKWPEDGRSRKVFSIDEAIEMTTRDELRAILIEVKKRNLHLAATLARNK
mmetsp:Transcript_39785/g.48466  ORF Transcript_39785/g.48466 Transcript_39785/m.48466 type:complete len:423 (+) Transcript_39785:218-1486(+)|eukprot:CAMPEP_0172479334 /NCGR_PEP_ID=MMETSP1066-20121228/3872_1 /TAXON_ID=671091 /ORGANISM="Coscinodiscus wailesii, Strain CCMP2513" /LENGTH=422 /DNA_ID=CAMNT_0013239727 /DNA_START=214 /DNA_END=1482 /DNA_ORIENTATION=+